MPAIQVRTCFIMMSINWEELGEAIRLDEDLGVETVIRLVQAWEKEKQYLKVSMLERKDKDRLLMYLESLNPRENVTQQSIFAIMRHLKNAMENDRHDG